MQRTKPLRIMLLLLLFFLHRKFTILYFSRNIYRISSRLNGFIERIIFTSTTSPSMMEICQLNYKMSRFCQCSCIRTDRFIDSFCERKSINDAIKFSIRFLKKTQCCSQVKKKCLRSVKICIRFAVLLSSLGLFMVLVWAAIVGGIDTRGRDKSI